MKRNLLGFLVLGTFITGAVLLQTKYNVQEKARELRQVAAQIHRDREAMRVLEAEWAYKTSPSKLQEQSMEYLALMPVMPRQVITDLAVVPTRRDPSLPVDGSVGVLLSVKDDKKDTKKAGQQLAEDRRKAQMVPVLYSTRQKRVTPINTNYQQTTDKGESQ